MSDKLTDREIEVIELMTQGLTNPEIAAQLHCKLGTVKCHAASIYTKLRVTNRTQAAMEWHHCEHKVSE